MLFNTNVNGDPRSFFYYKGDYYINGTEIILKDEYINQHQYNGKKIWKYAKYDHQVVCNGKVSYFFCRSRSDWLSLNSMNLDIKIRDDYAPYFVIEAFCLEYAIGEITHPIKLDRKETELISESIMKPQKDWDNNKLVVAWIIYILIMIASLIFKQFYIIWAVVSFIFFECRKEILNNDY